MEYEALTEYENNSVRLNIRHGSYSGMDCFITEEVQHAYYIDLIDYTKVTTAIDIGCHIGAWVVYLKKCNPAARIIGIDPDPENFALCRSNCASLEGVKLYEARCGYAEGDWWLAKHHDNSGAHTIGTLD